MFYKLGLTTFYGPCFICDLAELDNSMIPYTQKYFEKYFSMSDELKIESSDLWYNERPGYGTDQVGTSRKVNKEIHGFEVLNGSGTVRGKLLGGCIESIYETISIGRHQEEVEVCSKYGIFPSLEEWKDKIMFLETSEEKPTPEYLKIILEKFKELGIFNQIKGLIVGKPQDETYYEEYKEVYKDIFKGLDIPVIYNVNFGHSTPRCILPYGLMTELNCETKEIIVKESIFNND
jgi:muramoyltetrapeptide carboxypeptidase LdcA involved in peptidoglycan recycling